MTAKARKERAAFCKHNKFLYCQFFVRMCLSLEFAATYCAARNWLDVSAKSRVFRQAGVSTHLYCIYIGQFKTSKI